MLLKIITFLLMTLSTLFILWGGGLLWFATNISLAKPKQPSLRTDAIIVLTGGTGRIDEGLKLLTNNKSKKLFISGVNPKVQENDILPKNNKSLCCITLGYEASNTKENATEVSNWISEQNIKNIRLVTSNYHIIRAMLEFKKTLPNLDIIAHPVVPKKFNMWDQKFWPITFSEYNKTILIWLQFNKA